MAEHCCPSIECAKNNHYETQRIPIGWVCPKCQSANAPTNIFCANCSGWIMAKPEDRTKNCPCRRENGGSGICGCILNNQIIS